MTFGFIGTGSMGGALARAARRRLEGGQILLANRTEAKAAALAKELETEKQLRKDEATEHKDL